MDEVLLRSGLGRPIVSGRVGFAVFFRTVLAAALAAALALTPTARAGGLLCADRDVLGVYQPGGPIGGVFLDGDRAYLWRHRFGVVGLSIADITNPTAPVDMGPAGNEFGWPIYDLHAEAGVVYAMVAEGGFGPAVLQIVDLSDPSTPVDYGTFDWAGYDIEVVGSLAYLVDPGSVNSTLRILDVSDPGNPVEIGSVAVDESALFVAVDGPSAYVVSRGLLQFVDVSDPACRVRWARS